MRNTGEVHIGAFNKGLWGEGNFIKIVQSSGVFEQGIVTFQKEKVIFSSIYYNMDGVIQKYSVVAEAIY